MKLIKALGLIGLLFSFSVSAEDVPTTDAMSNQQLGEIVERLDPNVKGRPGFWQLTLEGRTILIITDENADRMRVMTQVADAKLLDKAELIRLMQANFDSALDARYAVAQDVLWSAFIHPLSLLDETEFISGVAQTVTLAHTYGDSYTSGALTFGGGDSNKLIERKLYERILRKGRTI